MRIKLTPKSRVWLLAAARLTGGPEAIHQLSRALLDIGVDARMVYCAERKESCEVPAPFKIYDPQIAIHAEDQYEDVVIVPEVMTSKLRSFRKAQKAVWWLSVDNYLMQRAPKELVAGAIRREPPLWMWQMKGKAHFYQSYYAQSYLESTGINDAMSLTDYLREDAFSSSEESERLRENIILYNPKKGIRFTERLISREYPTCQWVALQGMTAEQVSRLMHRAKLYVDFGNHPGKDRMPREAAISGCCVLTGRQGSAGNDRDIPIPDFYKVDERSSDWVEEAAGKIRDVMLNFRAHQDSLREYRNLIQNQRVEFLKEVRSAFCLSGDREETSDLKSHVWTLPASHLITRI